MKSRIKVKKKLLKAYPNAINVGNGTAIERINSLVIDVSNLLNFYDVQAFFRIRRAVIHDQCRLDIKLVGREEQLSDVVKEITYAFKSDFLFTCREYF